MFSKMPKALSVLLTVFKQLSLNVTILGINWDIDDMRCVIFVNENSQLSLTTLAI